MIIRLPKWCILNKFPAFHDAESLTAIEQTARLYGKVNEIIESYNKFAEEINKAIDEYESNADKEQDSFICQLSQLTHNFINTVDMKIAHQDRAIAEVYDNLKNDIKTAIDLQISEFLTEGEIENLVNNALININNVVSGFETELAEISAYNAQQDSRLNQIETNVTELSENVNHLSEENVVQQTEIGNVRTALETYKQTNDNVLDELRESVENANNTVLEYGTATDNRLIPLETFKRDNETAVALNTEHREKFKAVLFPTSDGATYIPPDIILGEGNLKIGDVSKYIIVIVNTDYGDVLCVVDVISKEYNTYSITGTSVGKTSSIDRKIMLNINMTINSANNQLIVYENNSVMVSQETGFAEAQNKLSVTGIIGIM